MKAIMFSLFLFLGALFQVEAQSCASCGSSTTTGLQNNQAGLSFHFSLGSTMYGQSAGSLTLSSSQPDASLFTPLALHFTAADRADIAVLATNVVVTNTTIYYEVDSAAIITTNWIIFTNVIFDGTVTNTTYTTNANTSVSCVTTTNAIISQSLVTNAVILQVQTPAVVADIPMPPTTNGYVVNFYYTPQITGSNANGTCQFSGSPFITWIVTNANPTGSFQVQISQFGNVPNYGLMNQWAYNYSTNNGTWSVQNLSGVQENTTVTNLDATSYAIIDTVQYAGGPVVQQSISTYKTFVYSTCTYVALAQLAVGSSALPEVTTYSYWNPATFNAGSMILLKIVTHPDGSWERYDSYDTNGNPLTVYSSFADVSTNNYTSARKITYNYGSSVVAGSGDTGIISPNTPRQTIEYIAANEVARSYHVFPTVGERLDIQCIAAGAAWSATGNLVTTNFYYTNGPNQFSLQKVIRPDGTMTTYNYVTNATYQTNIIVTGQPDSTYSYIIDGMSNVTVMNISGYMLAAASYDVVSGLTTSQDAYGNFDSYGRPQQVVHLDGTTNVTQYACCGLDLTIDSDGLLTQYLYDPARRAVGYQKIYNGNPITFTNVLDAASRTIQSIRIGSDNSMITTSQSGYDLAGELIQQTNALGGVTTYTRANDPSTGGLDQTIVNADGSTITNFNYLDGSLKKTVGAIHGKAYGYGYALDVNGHTCTYSVETNLDNGGNLTTEWTKTFTDMAGRTSEILYADGHYSQSFYNSQGQLSKEIDPDGVVKLYQYNAKGEQTFAAVDMNRNGTIDFSGTDRITQTTNDVTTDHGTTVRRSRNYAWFDGQSTGTLISSMETSADSLDSWQAQYRDVSTAVITHSHTVPGTSRTVTSTAPDGSYRVNTYSYGRVASSVQYDSGGSQIGGTSYGYDPHGRQNTMTDARNGTTILGFNNADLIVTNTTPNPGGGSPEVTVTTYNNLMQATAVTQPDGTTVSSTYLTTGELGLQYGSRTYPVGYSYDYAGRMKTMTNWSGFNTLAGSRVTTWNYHSYRGWLASKAYPDGHGPSYTYTSAGRLATRTWVRGITTSYAYDSAGGLTNTTYSDGTPTAGNSYDRLGRLNSAVVNGMTDTMTYNLANELLGESFSGGVLNGLSVTNSYDQFLRRTNLATLASGILNIAAYGYDNASRTASVTGGNNNSASYSYVANSLLVSQITFKQSGTTRMTTTKSYDYLNRQTQISSVPSASYTSPLTFNYNYNPANQRTKNTLADGSYWIYGYDSLGQVTNACKYFADNTPVAGQQFDYTFDTIGNRTQTQAGGDATGANLRTANYYANNLNQITNRDVPAYVDVMGASILTNTVTVNGNTAYRKEEYYRQQLPANNSASALWTNVIVTGGQSVTGNVYVAKAPEQFSYDADGNLTNDGRWAYIWDGENRLKVMSVNTNVGPQYQLTFTYDSKGRRIQKIVATNGVALSTNNFLYDGWNLIAETRPDNSLIRSYVWGIDLSGASQDAGGVGGLLEISYYGSSTTNCFPAYDGNGNIMALVNAADGTVAANYDYGAFGEPIRITGVMASNNPFRFSTKYADDESDLLYYGYRFYKPSTGTWPNKDPMQEQGGMNLYGFVGNNPINEMDLLGEWGSDVHQGMSTEWSQDAGIVQSYAQSIGSADIGVDGFFGFGTGFLPPPLGDQSRHLKDTINGEDSRDYWYDTEYGTAVKNLQKADQTQNGSYCSQAAEAFGRGLHSRQDKSAHRPWPTGQDWTSAGGLIAHPGWWDAWTDSELSVGYPSDLFWHRWFQHNGDPIYDRWEGFNTQIGQMQYSSQLAARKQVVSDSAAAIGSFVGEVKKTCLCRKLMLTNQ